MFGKIHSPNSLPKSTLDTYLEKGWFRIRQAIFTCNFLNFNRTFYSAIWLRTALNNYQPNKEFKKLQKLNASFGIEIKKASITPFKENLYSKYKTSITFETADSLDALLLDEQEHNVYDTHEICIYDKDRLIAVGYFDLGENSAAGIVSFYDPEYRKHSLGKYLIYSKVNYCKAQGLSYFYPGYFAPHYAMFDYKLKIGKPALEFLNFCNNTWQAYTTFSAENILIDVMERKLKVLKTLLSANYIQSLDFKYEFFNANITFSLKDIDLFDYPLFLVITNPRHSEFQPIIIFDVVEQKYRLIRCVSYYFDKDYVSKDGYYGSHLMKEAEEIIAHEDESVFLDLLLGLFGMSSNS